MIVCGHKNFSDAINTLFKDHCDIGLYNRDIDDEILKKHLLNVDEEWADKNILIYTPVITTGINYNPTKPTYHKLYIYDSTCTSVIRDIFQASQRVRKILLNKVEYFMYGGFNKKLLLCDNINFVKKCLDANLLSIKNIIDDYTSTTNFNLTDDDYNESGAVIRNILVHNIIEENRGRNIFTRFEDFIKFAKIMNWTVKYKTVPTKLQEIHNIKIEEVKENNNINKEELKHTIETKVENHMKCKYVTGKFINEARAGIFQTMINKNKGTKIIKEKNTIFNLLNCANFKQVGKLDYNKDDMYKSNNIVESNDDHNLDDFIDELIKKTNNK